nr:hypothetical protein Iba_chr14bCG15310 [Ipomoea batatas]
MPSENNCIIENVDNEVNFLNPYDFNDSDSFDSSDDDDGNCVDTCENNSFNSNDDDLHANSSNNCESDSFETHDVNPSNSCENVSCGIHDNAFENGSCDVNDVNSFNSNDDDGLELFTFDDNSLLNEHVGELHDMLCDVDDELNVDACLLDLNDIECVTFHDNCLDDALYIHDLIGKDRSEGVKNENVKEEVEEKEKIRNESVREEVEEKFPSFPEPTPSSASHTADGPAFGLTLDSVIGPVVAAASTDGPAETSTTGTGKVGLVHRHLQSGFYIVLHRPSPAVEGPSTELVHQVFPDRSSGDRCENAFPGLSAAADVTGKQHGIGEDSLPMIRALQDPSSGLFGRFELALELLDLLVPLGQRLLEGRYFPTMDLIPILSPGKEISDGVGHLQGYRSAAEIDNKRGRIDSCLPVSSRRRCAPRPRRSTTRSSSPEAGLRRISWTVELPEARPRASLARRSPGL